MKREKALEGKKRKSPKPNKHEERVLDKIISKVDRKGLRRERLVAGDTIEFWVS